MTLVESPVFWQVFLSALGGWLTSFFIHTLFVVPSRILRTLYE